MFSSTSLSIGPLPGLGFPHCFSACFMPLPHGSRPKWKRSETLHSLFLIFCFFRTASEVIENDCLLFHGTKVPISWHFFRSFPNHMLRTEKWSHFPESFRTDSHLQNIISESVKCHFMTWMTYWHPNISEQFELHDLTLFFSNQSEWWMNMKGKLFEMKSIFENKQKILFCILFILGCYNVGVVACDNFNFLGESLYCTMCCC